MLESNTFRFMMLIGGIIIMALFVTAIFTYPMVELDESGMANYEMLMGVELAEGKDWLSIYEAAWYKVQAVIRRDVTHY